MRHLSINRKRKSQSNHTFLEDCFVSDSSSENNVNKDVECVCTGSKADKSSEFNLPSQPPSPPNLRQRSYQAAQKDSLVESVVEIRTAHPVDSDGSPDLMRQTWTSNTVKYKPNNQKYSIQDAVDYIVNNNLIVPEAF